MAGWEIASTSYINGDHLGEAMGLRVIVMSAYHGRCAIGKFKVEDDDGDVQEYVPGEME